ncbi:signal peptide peptidase SppA [Parasalinivibrio latis]|uniref:signal peptide peptidase SppA n=1 Tax=Parasalinivibrio latis TaxID=2952610 RepID=UPI0030E50AB1
MKALFKFIGGFFKLIWKTLSFTRQLILNLLFLLIVAIVIIGWRESAKLTEEPVQTGYEGALLVNLYGPIVEQATYSRPVDNLSRRLLGDELPTENVLFDIVDAIRAAAQDDKITGLVLSLSDMPETSLTKLRYIAKAINEFKASGKPVFAVGSHYSQSQYYLASYADEVLMAPDGGVMLQGYSSYQLYFKRLLDKLDVTTHVFRVGTYKSAVEPFIRDDMSNSAREANSVWLKQLWAAYTSDVAHNRDIEAASLSPDSETLISRMKQANGDFARFAVNMGLVDKLANRPETRQFLEEKFGSDGDHSFKHISLYDYYSTPAMGFNITGHDQIAVVVASGAIIDGPSRDGAAGGDTIAAQLRDARFDDKIKAVILRVNSPGGSAFASEVIRNEIQALKAAGKPVVVSMSSMAASGGYWISSDANQIIAQPTTITGSIGIFGLFTTFEDTLDKYGISSDGLSTTQFGGVSPIRPLPQAVSDIMQLGIENGYQRFLSVVSQGRNMSMVQAEKVAEGRVWTGQDALDRGLVDQLGDFDDAVKVAAKLADLDRYELNWMQEPLSPFEQAIQDLMGQVSVSLLGQPLQSMLPTAFKPLGKEVSAKVSLLNNFNDPNGQYVFCLNCTYN